MTHLTQTQMTELLRTAQQADSSGRLYLMILLAWRHGLRASEVCSLRVKDFDLSGGGYITVQRLKGSLKTTQPLFPDELSRVTLLVSGKTPSDFLFPGRFPNRPVSRQFFWEKFQDLCRSIGIPQHAGHPHVLKHSCGMVLIKQGIENTRQYLGHKSISSTGAYLKVSDEAASRAAQAAFAQ